MLFLESKIIGNIRRLDEFKKIDLIINRLRIDMVKRGDMMSSNDVIDILAIPLIGIVPDDENVVIATNQGEPLVGTDTPAGKAYANICERIMGKEIPFLQLEKSFSFWTKVTGIFHSVKNLIQICFLFCGHEPCPHKWRIAHDVIEFFFGDNGIPVNPQSVGFNDICVTL